MLIINPSQDSWFHTRETVWESKTNSIQRNIGEFHKDFYIQKIEKLAYYHSYSKILGKHHVADVRHKAFEYTPGDISNRSDYDERFSFEPDGKLQNKLFDNNSTLSTEGWCLYRFKKNSQCKHFLWQCWWVYSSMSWHVTVVSFTFIWFKAAKWRNDYSSYLYIIG